MVIYSILNKSTVTTILYIRTINRGVVLEEHGPVSNRIILTYMQYHSEQENRREYNRKYISYVVM